MMKMKKVVIALSISVMSAAGMALAAALASPVYSENGDYPAAVVPYAQKAHTMGPVSHTYSENGDYLAAVVPYSQNAPGTGEMLHPYSENRDYPAAPAW